MQSVVSPPWGSLKVNVEGGAAEDVVAARLDTGGPISTVSTGESVGGGPSVGAALFLPLSLVALFALFAEGDGADVADEELVAAAPLAVDISILLRVSL